MNFVHLATPALLAAAALAQACPRPTPPPGGFAIHEDLQVQVTLSDGYVAYGTMKYPDVVPPGCGWPLVVMVHPLGSWRVDLWTAQAALAGQGFAVWAYDVRAHGQGPGANPGHPNGGTTLWGPVERHDLAEQIAFVGADPAYAGIADATRVAVMGVSQGGAHAWQAAAFSGTLLTTPGRTPITFPAVACTVATDLVPDPIDDWLRGGAMFSSWFVAAIDGSYTGIPFDANFLQTARDAFEQQDPAGLQAAYAAEGRGVADALATTAVPVLYGHAYLDNIDSPVSGVERMEAMVAPHRAVLGSVGHGVPANGLQITARDNLTLRWLNRYLWDVPNEVELEEPNVLSLVPLDPADAADPTFAWSRRQLADLQPDPSARRWFLYDDLALRDEAPQVPQLPLSITQVVDPLATTFDPVSYLSAPSLRDAPAVLAACPLSEQVWTLDVADTCELARSARLHLHVVPDAASWMLAATLSVQPPGGTEVLLGGRAVASRSSTPGVDEWHELRLPPVATRIPAGSTLRLRLRNLWLRDPPMQSGLEVAPIFGDFQVVVVLGDQPGGSWLDLPLEVPRPRLVADRERIDLDTAQPINATLRAGDERAGFPYFAAVGISGQVPTTNYLGETIPTDGDWLVIASAANTWEPAFYQGFLGFLDNDGNAQLVLDYSAISPLPQFLNGLQLTLVGFVWDGPWAPTGAASNAFDVMLR
ncbi:MAG: hypothetical protein H6835_10350 [Planctomycetes bacterium]|nr:hypothetical protein [Planctomycetota bacterium]